MTTETTFAVTGKVWVVGPDHDGLPFIDGAAGELEIERTDVNEIRIAINAGGGSLDPNQEEASFYMTDGEAARLAHMLGATILD